jgi:hypothetical protein
MVGSARLADARRKVDADVDKNTLHSSCPISGTWVRKIRDRRPLSATVRRTFALVRTDRRDVGSLRGVRALEGRIRDGFSSPKPDRRSPHRRK